MKREEAVILVNEYHQLYMQKLTELYNENKDKYFSKRQSEMKFVQ